MYTITYTNARQHLKSTMEKVVEDHAPIMITRQEAEPVVMMSLADYNAMEETLYLMRSPKNAKRLRDAYDDAMAGRGLIKYEPPAETKKKSKRRRPAPKGRRG